ncbi:MAG TPA: hypothetical protein PKK69_01915 [Ferruginibacter sp.]|nr:hypothetical protein [Ferruginibacter sp.]
MKLIYESILVLVFICASHQAQATNYYIDPSASSSHNKGTQSDPWTDPARVNDLMDSFKAGDSILFRRGQWFHQSIVIRCSGTTTAPVYFGAYGPESGRPVFLYPKGASGQVELIRCAQVHDVVIADWEITDDKLRRSDPSVLSRIKTAIALESAARIQILRCDISNVGVGVNILGSDNKVMQTSFTSLRMVRNTAGGNDDYGANPVVIAGANNEIGECVFRHCWARSYDYEYDGGAIEFFGPDCARNRIWGNTAFDCNGFIEMGSDAGGVALDNIIESNLVVNCGDFLYINNKGDYAIHVRNLYIQKNVVIQSIEQLTKPAQLIGLTSPSADPDVLFLKQNIFWVSTGINLLRPGMLTPTQVRSSGNTIYLKSGNSNLPVSSSNKIMSAASKQLNCATVGSTFCDKMDLYPYRYLIPHWQTIF